MHRQAFGRPIGGVPRRPGTLADMAATSVGALHLVFALTGLEDAIDAGTADGADVASTGSSSTWPSTSLVQATDVVHSAVEVLGGNGTIEEFSVLPRLYRDTIVYESWEGSHNVLVAQVLNDLRRLPILDVVGSRLGGCLDRATGSAPGEAVRSQRGGARRRPRCIDDPDFGDWHFRGVLDRLGVLAEAAYLVEAGEEACASQLLAGLPRRRAGVRGPGYVGRTGRGGAAHAA